MPIVTVQPAAKADSADDSDVLVGLWEAVIEGNGATYRYIYSMTRGSYVATGNIDENFMNFKYSPTMGTYVRRTDGAQYAASRVRST